MSDEKLNGTAAAPAGADGEPTPIIFLDDIRVTFKTRTGSILHPNKVQAVRGLTLKLMPGQTLGIVGESGCGKSTTANVMCGLQQPTSGRVFFKGKDVTKRTAAERRLIGRVISVVFQDPATALNARMSVHDQLMDPLVVHKIGDKASREARVQELIEMVGLPGSVLDALPGQLSGGQRQRVAIARALSLKPDAIIADEPTTALDVTVQKQVIDLLNKLQKELGFAMVFVSHDLALVAEVANSITVMYAGQVVEQGPVTDILCHPVHEYTRGLLGSVLSIEAGGARLHQVPGSVPSPKDFPEGDRFTPRSSHPDKVSQLRPVLKRVEGTDHYYGELPDSELKRLGIKPYVPGGPLI